MTQYEQNALALYQAQMIEEEKERRLRSGVTVLQGLAAIVTIISFFALVIRKKN